MHATRIFIVLALALLALPVHAEINVSLLYGWNQTHWTPVRVTTAGALMTDLNLTESIGINPKSDNTYNLGAASLRWASVYGVNGYFADSFGIGTVAPRRKLQINGSAGVSLETNESAYLAIGENQKVGIGLNMTSPLGTVHINSSNALGALRIENTTGTQLLFVNGSSGNVGIGTATLDTDARLQVDRSTVGETARFRNRGTDAVMNISLVNDAQTWGIQVDGLDSDKFKIVDFQPDPDVTVMTFVKSTGNVGIGTTGPGDMLHIYSTSGAGTAGLTIQSTVADSYPGIDLKNDARSWNIAADGTTSDALVFYDITAAQYRMVINTDGNLGIGTTSPSERLHVAGNMTITENLTVQRNLTVQHNLSVGGSTLYVNSAAGRVGIGTGTPAAPLHIQKDGSGEVTQLQLDDSTAKTWSTTVRDMIYMESRYTGQVLDYSTANINWGYTDTFQNNGATLAFDIVDSTGSWKNTVTIKGSGNVGIGDTTPNQALDVAGSINFTGRITSDPNSGTGGFGNLIASGTGDASGSFKIDANEIGVVYLYSWTNGNDHGRISSYLVGGASSNVYSATIADTGAADVTHSVSLSGTGDHTVTYTMTDDTASEVLDGWRVYYMKIGGD